MAGTGNVVVVDDPMLVLDEETVRELHEREESRRDVLRHLVETMEEERRRLAVDIHDDSVQAMLAVGMRLGMLRTKNDDPAQHQELAKLERVVRETVVRLRDLIFELSPPSLEFGGLTAALHDALDQLNRDTGIEVDLDAALPGTPPTPTAALAYRLVMEALANVRTHARARHVGVRLHQSGGMLCVRVRDDGRGFDLDRGRLPTAPGHLGLVSMRQRCEAAGGSFDVWSAPGRGTRVSFLLPLEE